MLPDLLHMQTLHYEVLDLDKQIESLEADLKARDELIKTLFFSVIFLVNM